MDHLLAKSAISIIDLKNNPSVVIKEAEKSPIAILYHNRPSAYLVSADAFEALLEKLDDLDLMETIRKRGEEKSIPGSLAAL